MCQKSECVKFLASSNGLKKLVYTLRENVKVSILYSPSGFACNFSCLFHYSSVKNPNLVFDVNN